MDDIIEIVAETAADVVEDSLFSRFVQRKASPLTRFLLGLAGAGIAGLLCYGIVALLLH